MTQFYSRIDTEFNGDVYNIPFSYSKESEISVYLDDELFTDWYFLNESQIKFTELPSKTPEIVTIRRTTDITKKVVEYTNNTMLSKEALNLSQDQLLNAVQEIYDNNTQFAIDIRAEVDEKVERVSAAVEKLEEIDASVETSVQKAQEATEQAQIATEKAEETLNTYNEAMAEIDTLRQNSIDEVNQLVSDHTDDLNILDQLIKKDADAIINRVGFNMFDTVLKDHILTYEESKGLALQGTYVYKDAIAGSRYGYPDFYNKCLEEYSNSNNTYEILRNNYKVVGSPTITEDGVASGFSNNDYITIPFDYSNPIFEISLNVDYPTEKWAEYSTVILALFGSSASNHVRCGLLSSGQFIISTVIDGVLKHMFLGSSSINTLGEKGVRLDYGYDGTNFYVKKNGILVASAQGSTISSVNTTLYIGRPIYNDNWYWFGSIDLKNFSITVDGKEVYRAVDYITTNPNGHRFYPINSKTLIDSTYEQTGMAWMYGIDQENERIFLPRNVWFEQMSMTDVGKAVEAGLPNITGSASTNTILNNTRNQDGTVGAITTAQTGTIALSSGGGQQGLYSLSFNASRSNAIYGKSDTVQPNAVKKLLYICVGNTVSQSTITDVVDVTTTENDTIPLFTGMYFDFTPNNISWVKAGEQRNSGGVYTFCYNELVNELTNPKYDIKVVEIKNMIAGIDYSEYWKVNQDDMTFATPTAISGIVAEQATSKLYFKVANAVQNLELMDVARIEATKANKTDVDGQWVLPTEDIILNSSTALGTYIIDLSEYLPNDGYNYEIYGSLYISRSDSSGSNTNAYVDEIINGIPRVTHCAWTIADGANFQQSTTTYIAVVDNSRSVRVRIENVAPAGQYTRLLKYRRLGTKA